MGGEVRLQGKRGEISKYCDRDFSLEFSALSQREDLM